MSAKQNSSSTSMWLKFFRAAGINPGIDTKYALIFDENRIRMTMLMDIDKECLKDMGITAMGDIIAITKHARKIHDETKEQAVETNKPSQSDPPSPPPPSTVSTAKTTVVKSSVAKTTNNNSGSTIQNSKLRTKLAVTASKGSLVKATASPRATQVGNKGLVRVITSKSLPLSSPGVANKKAVSFESDPAEKKIIVLNKRPSETVPLREEVPLQKKIRVLPEHEGKYKIKMPEGTTPRTQKVVQNRLGPAISDGKREEKKTVFDRLGDSSVSSSTEVRQQQKSTIMPPSSDFTSPPSQDRSYKTSIFDRLGDRDKQDREDLLRVNLVQSTPKISLVDNSSQDRGLSQRFEVRQDVFKESPPRITPPPKRLTESRHNAYTEKTLVTIPSRISIPYMTNTNKYRLKSEISSPAPSSSSTSSSSPSTVRLISTKSSTNSNSQSPQQQQHHHQQQQQQQQHYQQKPSPYISSSFVREEQQVRGPTTSEEGIIRIARPPADLHQYVPDEKSINIMKKMGWLPGKGLGLGRNNQGRKYCVDGGKTRDGKNGLGYFTAGDQKFKYL